MWAIVRFFFCVINNCYLQMKQLSCWQWPCCEIPLEKQLRIVKKTLTKNNKAGTLVWLDIEESHQYMGQNKDININTYLHIKMIILDQWGTDGFFKKGNGITS